jgi:hypothetical protein
MTKFSPTQAAKAALLMCVGYDTKSPPSTKSAQQISSELGLCFANFGRNWPL